MIRKLLPRGAVLLAMAMLLLTLTTGSSMAFYALLLAPDQDPAYLVMAQVFLAFVLNTPLLLISRGRTWAMKWLKANHAIPVVFSFMAMTMTSLPWMLAALASCAAIAGLSVRLLYAERIVSLTALFARRRIQRERWGRNNRELLRRYQARVAREEARTNSAS